MKFRGEQFKTASMICSAGADLLKSAAAAGCGDRKY